MQDNSTRTPQLTQKTIALPIEAIARFWAKVYKKTDTECWLWIGSVDGKGYGKMQVRPKLWAAHRLSWLIHFSSIPQGLVVCHNCPDGDNPRCVNPKHLFLGTVADNNADMHRKGRHAHGETHYKSILTEELVQSMRQEVIQGASIVGIAHKYDITEACAGSAIRGETWRQIVDVAPVKTLHHWTLEEINTMHTLLEHGYTKVEVSRMLGRADRAVESQLYREK